MPIRQWWARSEPWRENRVNLHKGIFTVANDTIPTVTGQPGGKPAPTRFTMKPGGIPPGVYKVSFSGVEVSKDQRFGPGLVWQFQVVDGTLTGSKTNRITAAQPTPKNSCGKMIAGLAGRPLQMGDDVDVEQYIGQVYTAIVTDPDGGGSRVEQLMPAN